eukprot:TRINITY_DN50245_c0_g1_i1.p1 TRINITY_DN50245_c0_g1~~TRINITY_DN50245_c0_g1_i1.p1  ORF type:complete len:229 (+),score=35.35 TRINITY_DN50245_c0_g1_i1:66-689(+)
MRTLELLIAASVATSVAQDPSTMATMMAGRVAGVVAQKAEQKLEDAIENPSKPVPCTGPGCCPGSTCMGIPGMRCSEHRGKTQCVGWSAMSATEGMCQCLTGVCSSAGVCSDSETPTLGTGEPAPLPSQTAHTQQREFTDEVKNRQGPQSGGGIPIVPIACGLVLANVVIWGTIYCIRKQRRSGGETSEDEETAPLAYKRRFDGPGH